MDVEKGEANIYTWIEFHLPKDKFKFCTNQHILVDGHEYSFPRFVTFIVAFYSV